MQKTILITSLNIAFIFVATLIAISNMGAMMKVYVIAFLFFLIGFFAYVRDIKVDIIQRPTLYRWLIIFAMFIYGLLYTPALYYEQKSGTLTTLNLEHQLEKFQFFQKDSTTLFDTTSVRHIIEGNYVSYLIPFQLKQDISPIYLYRTITRFGHNTNDWLRKDIEYNDSWRQEQWYQFLSSEKTNAIKSQFNFGLNELVYVVEESHTNPKKKSMLFLLAFLVGLGIFNVGLLIAVKK